MEQSINQEHWTSMFLHYVPAEQAEDIEGLQEAALQFLEVHPECPFNHRWLSEYFIGRL